MKIITQKIIKLNNSSGDVLNFWDYKAEDLVNDKGWIIKHIQETANCTVILLESYKMFIPLNSEIEDLK